MAVDGYEIEVLRNGTWSLSERFQPNELSKAQARCRSLELDKSIDGLKLIEETLGPDDRFIPKTLLRKTFDRQNDGADTASGARDRGAGLGHAPGPSGKLKAKPKKSAAKKKNPVPRTAKARAAKPVKAPDQSKAPETVSAKPKRFSFGQIIEFFRDTKLDEQEGSAPAHQTDNTPGATGATASASVSSAPSPAAVTIKGKASNGKTSKRRPPDPEMISRGDVGIFKDEINYPTPDLIAIDSTFQQGMNFFDFSRTIFESKDVQDTKIYAYGVCLFVVGGIFEIEQDIDLTSTRGTKVLRSSISLFITDDETVQHFVDNLARYLTEPDAPKFLKAGARSFRSYREGAIERVGTLAEECFGLVDPVTVNLGNKAEVGILFTDIVDSTRMTSEIGDDGAQRVVEHHEDMVDASVKEFNGRRVKHLGDGLMLSFASLDKMMQCARAIHQAKQAAADVQIDVPEYAIKVGGHFGEAIEKEGDFFGSTVQLAARVAGVAEAGEVCFVSEFTNVAQRLNIETTVKGAWALKGITGEREIITLG
ncbi:MAG: adenylate/guanylate cyclase domain-containing protein [Rhodospirillaceae bacterium]|nr:adenylate/guanylate cyclase domain-containing protein [Rhodospirillaceae bacterium]MBT6136816.1 adenylate/guanylate cyclase domain-containing protein [Rhodospirillaceae bacterium]